jgi:hypothetical protein
LAPEQRQREPARLRVIDDKPIAGSDLIDDVVRDEQPGAGHRDNDEASLIEIAEDRNPVWNRVPGAEEETDTEGQSEFGKVAEPQIETRAAHEVQFESHCQRTALKPDHRFALLHPKRWMLPFLHVPIVGSPDDLFKTVGVDGPTASSARIGAVSNQDRSRP